jgi:UDP-N-acetylmuramoyl-tripeptide--D-alanyl-D-alanine ligase
MVNKQKNNQTLSAEELVTRLQNQMNSPQGNSLESVEGDRQMQSKPEALTPTDNGASFSWTLADLCQSVDGELIGALDAEQQSYFTSISTDSRTLKAGALYIAIKGDNFDGHKFIKQAIQQGAVAILLSEIEFVDDLLVPGVLVDDTRIAFGLFAKWHRLQMPVKKLIAVTGSNGKTTTKTLLLEIFQQVGKTLATEGNLNNDFGLPRTLLNLRPEHEFAIIEMGANHPQEIAYLTHLALPDIALINNASGAHLEGFGSLQGVIETKGEIFQGLNQRRDPFEVTNQGVAVVNCDSPGYTDWLVICANLGVKKVVNFGADQESTHAVDVRISHFKVTESGICFDLHISEQLDPTHKVVQKTVEMPVLGQHNALNAAACVAVALSAGLGWSQIQPGLVSFSGVPGRLQKQAIKTGWLIDDSYNANPASVKAGIDALTSLPGQAILCLGAMAELGDTALAAHQEIALYAKQKGVDFLLTYGQATQQMASEFGEQASYFESHKRLTAALTKILLQQTQDNQLANVLVKGSRSAQMERVTHAVIELFAK